MNSKSAFTPAGINALGWHVFNASGLSAYEATWVAKWCVAATGGSWCAEEGKPPKDADQWSYSCGAARYGYVWGNGAARLQPVTAFLASQELADAFAATWCGKENDDAMRAARKQIAEIEAAEAKAAAAASKAVRQQLAASRAGGAAC